MNGMCAAESKVFIDVGTNLMQGFEELSRAFGVDDTWKVCLIEPNKDCHDTILAKIQGQPNKKLYRNAVDSKEGVVMFVRTKEHPTDTAGTICGKNWLTDLRMKFNLNTNNVEEYPVETINISRVMDEYPDHSFWLKLDCEGKEYDILENLDITKYDIRALVVEFHILSEADIIRAKRIIERFSRANIPVHLWN